METISQSDDIESMDIDWKRFYGDILYEMVVPGTFIFIVCGVHV